MSSSHDNLLDRLLRYAPWVAGAFVAACVVALIVRVVSDAGSGGQTTESLSSAVAADKVTQAERKKSPHLALRPETATASEGRRTQTAAASQVPPTTGPRAAAPQRSLKEPQTPRSKSRLEMHGVRRGAPAPEQKPKLAAKATSKSFIASSRSFSADLNAKAAPAVNIADKLGLRAPALDGQGSTSFFGVEASGKRFAYVLDRSGSMGEPRGQPMRAAKSELLASLDRLDSLQQFFLIFYNEEVRQFVPAARGRHFADEGNKRAANRFVESVQAQGGTSHFEALQRAINLRPDVIFLLTDGEQKDDLSSDELKRLGRLNGGLAQIHVVQFAPAPYAGNSLVQLAAENRGQHTYKNVRETAKSASLP